MIGRAIDLGNGRRARRVCIDATNERLFATDLRRHFLGLVPVELMIWSEGIEYMGTRMSVKVYLGGLIVRSLEDDHLLLPRSPWLMKDLRQPEGFTFQADVDEDGNHADVFGAISQSIHALIAGSGPVMAAAAAVGTHGAPATQLRPGLVGPLSMAGRRPVSSVPNVLRA